ncbi:SpoIIE family protein phosphatase [Pseudoroseicyclus sp. H15]
MLECLTIAARADVAAARQQARAEALQAGLGHDRAEEIAIVATELATNILKYAHTGSILAQAMPQPEGTSLALIAFDQGPGIENLDQMRKDWVSGGAGAGIGIGAIERLSDRAEVLTGPSGTIWACAFDSPDVRRPQELDIAGLRIAYPTEQSCGDDWGTVAQRGGARLVLADGMGHGKAASKASQAMIELALAHPGQTPKQRLFDLVEDMTRTRGGVISILDFAPGARMVSYGNLGNISGFYVRGGEQRRMVSRDGFVGSPNARPMEEQLDLEPGDIFVLHSDGLRTVAPEVVLGNERRSALMIAAIMLSDRERHRRDDVSVAVARWMPES